MSQDRWNPSQYERFRAERRAPFDDLVALLRSCPAPRVVDLGCGTGDLTAELHEKLGARETLGIDSSARMLEKAHGHAGHGLSFEQGDLGTFAAGPWDIVFSNAAIQWVEDHPALLGRLTGLLAPGGQLAVQTPANFDHLSHALADAVAAEQPFAHAMSGFRREPPVLAPERYAELLFGLGFREQHVRLQVYPHVLESADAIVEWVKGTLLTAYEARLPAALFPAFVDRYRDRLREALGDPRPCFYPFKRILIWARR
jgi:trans-aconitate 2-methyltransferase